MKTDGNKPYTHPGQLVELLRVRDLFAVTFRLTHCIRCNGSSFPGDGICMKCFNEVGMGAPLKLEKETRMTTDLLLLAEALRAKATRLELRFSKHPQALVAVATLETCAEELEEACRKINATTTTNAS